MQSLSALSVLLEQYPFFLDIKLMKNMRININPQMKQCLVKSNKSKWAEKQVKYLGFTQSKGNKDLIVNNLTLLITTICKHLQQSWLGLIIAIKMKNCLYYFFFIM